MLEVALSYCKHLTCKGWYISKYVCKAFSITLITTPITYSTLSECRINYCLTKLCLFLDVHSEDHWSRSSCTRKSRRISVPAGKQCSPELDSPSCQFKCPFRPNFIVFAGKTYRHSFKQMKLFPTTLAHDTNWLKIYSLSDCPWRRSEKTVDLTRSCLCVLCYVVKMSLIPARITAATWLYSNLVSIWI